MNYHFKVHDLNVGRNSANYETLSTSYLPDKFINQFRAVG